jgi:uncharacterized protein with ATP-grasp and redox domains
MRVHLDCFPCFLRQSNIALRLGTKDELLQERILKDILPEKGSPVINDSTMEDALESGLTGVCEVIDNGSDAVGTILAWTSSTFQETFEDAQLIISKGQGNFETLTGIQKKIFFLFQSKCDVVSKELGLSTGSMLLKKS